MREKFKRSCVFEAVIIMDEVAIPEDLKSLKRPALQKLCKQHGIKANGKNVDMIAALEELRSSFNKGDPITEASIDQPPPSDEIEPTPNAPVSNQSSPSAPTTPATQSNDRCDVENDESSSSPKLVVVRKQVRQRKRQTKGRKHNSKQKRNTRKRRSSSTESMTTTQSSPPPQSTNDSSSGLKVAHTNTAEDDEEQCSKLSETVELPESTQPVATSTHTSPNPTSKDVSLTSDNQLPSVVETAVSLSALDDRASSCDVTSEAGVGFSRKRKRRDTYSLSPSSSSFATPNAAKQPRITHTDGGENTTCLLTPLFDNISVKVTPDDGCQSMSVSNNKENFKINMEATESETATSTSVHSFSPPISGEKPRRSNPKRKRNSTFTLSNENTPITTNTALAPFSPPQSDTNTQKVNLKRKRNSTFTISCSEDSTSVSAIEGFAMEMEEGDVTFEPETKRVRRETFSVSPKASCDDHVTSPPMSCDEHVTAGGKGDIEKEIMDMLEKRVEEIKSDPNYKPVFTASASLASRIPVKTSTAVKFDKAHKKQFNKMTSIVKTNQAKEKRARSLTSKFKHTPSCAKRSRPMLHVGEKQPSQNKPLSKPSGIPKPADLPSVGARKTHPPAPKKIKMACTKTSSSSVSTFRPNVLSTKQASFNFTSTGTTSAHNRPPATTPKTPKAGCPKTPGKTMVNKPSSAVKAKTPFNLQESLKKKRAITYKPYTGKLPTGPGVKK